MKMKMKMKTLLAVIVVSASLLGTIGVTECKAADVAYASCAMQREYVSAKLKTSKPGKYLDINAKYYERDAIHKGSKKHSMVAHSEDGRTEIVCLNSVSDKDKSMAKLDVKFTFDKGKNRLTHRAIHENYGSFKNIKIWKL